MIPKRLEKGDEIRVIAPSSSMGQEWMKLFRDISNDRFKDLGYKLTFGKHVLEIDEFSSSSIKSRVSDFNDAISDPNVKMIICVIGGYNSNELLDYLDYDLIKNNPKIICGYSDITAFTNAINSITGLVTYSGPAYFSFGMKENFEFTLNYFNKALTTNKEFEIFPSEKWSDDRWAGNQEDRTFYPKEDFWSLSNGKATGRIVGGNINTLSLLQGTKYMPSLKNTILFLEDCINSDENVFNFKRQIQSLTQQKDFSQIKGIVFGKFEKGYDITKELLQKIIAIHPILKNIPIIGNVDFGHTFPQITFPIGGTAKLEVNENKTSLILSNE